MRKTAGVVLLVLLLAGCTRSAPTGLAVASVSTARINALHLQRHLTQAPRTLDPSLNEDVSGYTVIDDLFEGLVRLDAAGNIVPGIAERWESSPDGLLWRFHLRPQASWSNGQPVTAPDFIYSWRRVVDPATGSVNAQQLTPIAGASQIIHDGASPASLAAVALDAHTLEVRLAAPTPYFLYLLTNCWLMPLHEAALREHGAKWTEPGNLVSNGAFVLQTRAINGPIALLRNPRYWDERSVHLRAVTYFPVPDTASATARFLAGDLDVTDRFQLDDFGWLHAALGEQVRMTTNVATYMLGMHVTRPPFNDVRLRQAMVMALDREILTGKVMNGLYRPAYGIVPPLPDYAAVLPDWARLTDEARHREARRLYAAAGYSTARPLQVELWYPMADADTRRMLEAMAAMWRMNLGADVQLRNEEWRVHQQNRHIRKYRFFFYPWSGDYPEPLSFLALPMPGSEQNYMDFRDAAYAAAVGTAVRSTEPRARQAAYHEAERILNAAAVVVPVYYYQSRHLLRSQVQGWHDNPMDRHSSRDLQLAQAGNP